jgi:hypothetical protein
VTLLLESHLKPLIQHNEIEKIRSDNKRVL